MRKNFMISLLLGCLASGMDVISIPEFYIGPEPREKAAICYNPIFNEILIFGGNNIGFYNDLWSFSLDIFRWKIVYPNSELPDPRSFAEGFMRVEKEEFCIFGGKSAKIFYHDLWCFNVRHQYWKKQSTRNDPPSLFVFQLTYFFYKDYDHIAVVGSDTVTSDYNLYLLNITNLKWEKIFLISLDIKTEFEEINPGLVYFLVQEYKNKLYIPIISFYNKLQFFIIYNLETQIQTQVKYTATSIFIFNYPPMSVCLIRNILYVLFEAGYASKIDLDKENFVWYYYTVHFEMTKKSSSTLVGDYLYSFGGWLYDDYHYNLVNSINFYNFLNETVYSLEVVSSFISPTARTHSGMCLIKGKFYVFGGKNKDFYLKDMWVYDPPSTTWALTTTTSISPSARSNFASSCEGDAFLVWGGEDITGLNNDIFIYNSLTNAWNSLTPVTVDMPSKRKGVCAVLKLPYAYITGGIDSNGICNDLWRFNFGNSTYVRIATVPGSINAKCFFYDNILEVIGGNDINEEPLGLRFEYSMLIGKVLSYSWGKRSGEILLKMPNGVLQIGGRGDDKRLLGSVMLNGSYVEDINDFLYLPSYVYYNHSIYYFSGSIFTTRFTLFQNLPRPKFAVMHLPPNEKLGSENYYCSEGFFAYKGICEKCPAGTYASGIGNRECLKCDKGFYNSFQGASSVRQCYPCPEGTYNNYAGGTMCKECPQGNNCPTGSRDPANTIEKTATTYSVQPNLYQGVNLDSELALIQYLGALITGISLILILAIPKLSDLIKKFDLYSTQHSYDEGDYIKIEKKKIGGVFSLIFIGASFVLTTSVLVIFIWGNISESKSLIPLVILESEVKDFATNFEVEISLENYGDKCVKNNDKDICSDLIDVNSENIDRKQVLMKCYISLSRTCKVRYICSNCRVRSKATINLIFQEKLSYASGISVNVTSDSSIPESRSSVYSSISPQAGFIFIGPSPNAFYFTLTPSYFTSSVSKFPSQLIGYHVDSSVLPTTGSQNLIENLSVTAQISVTIILEQILVGLYTSRFAKQSTLLLISGIFGTVTGLMGIVGIIMGKFEGFFKEKSQEITRKDRVKEIAHKRNEVIEMLFENHTIPVKISKGKSETLSIVSLEGNTR